MDIPLRGTGQEGRVRVRLRPGADFTQTASSQGITRSGGPGLQIGLPLKTRPSLVLRILARAGFPVGIRRERNQKAHGPIRSTSKRPG